MLGPGSVGEGAEVLVLADVELRQGKLGDAQGLCGVEADPTEAIPVETRAILEKLGANIVHLGHSWSGARFTDDDVFARWFGTHGHTYAIIRPDFFTAATATGAEQLSGHLDSLLGSLNLTPASA
ncbi:hypothetical protein [Corynebacterium guangdongense]|uniref:Uncharacterized protein n=1 Tax=Corynebacterium guangdongense TaxID=1783348 RepID=A0ABU1ZW31_9CORY|nr:hypothetical protein [Corynebacterium guangdongense]MDR7328573.1 hypothetical protein [Corynebacterium guangdongense]WJZ17150.1 3-(3-hydroxyphenyl)propionate hydroxylase [Corynebacterium guangdongense]